MRYRAEDFQKDFWVNIGKRIRLRREQFGLTRDQLSYEIGVSEKTLGQIERGEHGCSVARLFMIASKLNISVDRLLKGTPQETLLPASSSRERIDLLLEGRPEIQLDSIYHVLLSEAQLLVLKKYFSEYKAGHPSDVISFFSSGEELLQNIISRPTIHFALLDIELPGISGIELADLLRRQYPNVLIVFITNHPQYIRDAFKLHSNQYILKPVQSRTLFSVLKTLQHEYYTSHIQYVENERRLITVAYSDIVYVEFYRNTMTVHTAEQVFSMEVVPKEMKKTLLERGLIRTHQGFFVNPVHIKSIESDYVFCINDIEVPISHRERKNLIKKFSERYASMISKV